MERVYKIQLDCEVYRAQAKKLNKHVIQFSLFVFSKPHWQAEF